MLTAKDNAHLHARVCVPPGVIISVKQHVWDIALNRASMDVKMHVQEAVLMVVKVVQDALVDALVHALMVVSIVV